MYAWRKWTPEMRDEVLAFRKRQHRPWHGPPHFTGQQTDQYLITGACYEHAPILGATDERLDAFVLLLHQAFEEAAAINSCVVPASQSLPCADDDIRSPGTRRTTGKTAWQHLLHLEWRGQRPWSPVLAPRDRPRHAQRGTRLGHGELCPSQRGEAWPRREMDGLAVVECA